VRIDWHPLALRDLAELMAYVARESPNAAYRLHDEIRTQTDALAQNPEMGRPGRIRGTRELVINRTPYIAAYRVTPDLVKVLRLVHGRRRWPRKM